MGASPLYLDEKGNASCKHSRAIQSFLLFPFVRPGRRRASRSLFWELPHPNFLNVGSPIAERPKSQGTRIIT